MEIFTLKRRTDGELDVDSSRERLIAAYGEDTGFRDIENIRLGQPLNAKLVMLNSKRYFNGKHS